MPRSKIKEFAQLGALSLIHIFLQLYLFLSSRHIVFLLLHEKFVSGTVAIILSVL